VALLLSALVFAIAQGLNPIKAAYFTVTTAFGEQMLSREPPWMKVVCIVTAVAGGTLAAVVFCHLASLATAERLPGVGTSGAAPPGVPPGARVPWSRPP
jgi:hypothetical protein